MFSANAKRIGIEHAQIFHRVCNDVASEIYKAEILQSNDLL